MGTCQCNNRPNTVDEHLLHLQSIVLNEESQVDFAIIVVVSGIGSVFVGMSLLYLAIVITSLVTTKLEKDKKGKV